MTKTKMLKSFLVLMLFFGGVADCQIAIPTEFGEKFHTACEKAFAQKLAPGFAIGIVVNDSVLYQKGFGYADISNELAASENSRFYIASTTKALTALAVLSLTEEGLLSLDAPISRYLAELSLRPPLDADSITIKELLAHTHGIDDRGPVVLRTAFTGQFEKGELPTFLKYHEARKEPGEFRYGNIGYNVLGMVIEAVTGKDWKTVVEERVLTPIGMSSTTANISTVPFEELALPYRSTAIGYDKLYLAKADVNMHAAGGHFSTVHDMTRFLRAMINDGKINNESIFDSALIQSSRVPLTSQDRSFWEYKRFAWSPGWDVCEFRGENAYTRFGSFDGYFSYLGYFPDRRIGLVAYANETDLGGELINLATSYAIDLLCGHKNADSIFATELDNLTKVKSDYLAEYTQELATRAERQKEPLPFPLETYAGTYQNNVLGTMDWKMLDSQLVVEMGVAQCESEIYDAEQNQLRVELIGGGSVVSFEFSDGTATSFKMLGFTFERVK